MDPLLGYLLYHAVKAAGSESYFPSMFTTFVFFFLWLIFTKTIKLVPYFYRYPGDLKMLPVLYAFGYFQSLITIYTLLTLHKVSFPKTPILIYDMADERDRQLGVVDVQVSFPHTRRAASGL